jgi:release factor glutamine methyltransferase
MSTPAILLDILRRTETWLRNHGIEKPRLEAELLFAHVLGVDRMRVYLSYERPMSDDELEQLRALMRRRAEREPMAWILGSWGFHKLDLIVRPGVLVPRPDTETLVEAALSWIGAPSDPVFVADVGSGTGAVGLAIAHELPAVRLYATDLSPTALEVTRANVAKLQLSDRVAVLQGPFLEPIPAARPIDWVVSNPPYIPSRDIDGLQPEVAKWEPRLALDGGRDGLAAYRELIPAARARARKGLLLEVGYDQADDVKGLLTRAGFVDVRAWRDLGGHDRVVGGRIPAPA